MAFKRQRIFAVTGICAVICVGVLLAVLWAQHNSELRRRQLATLRSAVARYSDASRLLGQLDQQALLDNQKASRAYTAAIKAGKRRHDEYESLSSQEVYDLAKTERIQVDNLREIQRDIERKDVLEIASLTSLYGESAISQFQENLGKRNEARDNAFTYWWHAAQDNEDAAKDVVNGGTGDIRGQSEIEDGYKESDRYENQAVILGQLSGSEGEKLFARVAKDLASAKKDLAAAAGR
jgi:hypothetical protein